MSLSVAFVAAINLLRGDKFSRGRQTLLPSDTFAATHSCQLFLSMVVALVTT